MEDFISNVLAKIAVSFVKAIIVILVVGGCGMGMLFLAIEVINILEGNLSIYYAIRNSGAFSQGLGEQVVFSYLRTVVKVVPGDKLLGNVLGFNDFFEVLNCDFFLFLNDIIRSLKETELIKQNVLLNKQPLLREFAAITISSFIMVEMLRVLKMFFKFSSVGMIFGILYGAIYWVAASYAVSECILIFIEKIGVGKFWGIKKEYVLYLIIIITFVLLQILIRAFSYKELILKSGLVVIVNLVVEIIKTALAWYFIQTLSSVVRALIFSNNIENIMISLYFQISISLLLCLVVFAVLTFAQGKMQASPSKKDYENLGIIKFLSKIFPNK